MPAARAGCVYTLPNDGLGSISNTASIVRSLQGRPCFLEAFQAGKDQRPATRDRIDQFRIRPIHLMHDRQSDRAIHSFKLKSRPRVTLLPQFRIELVAAFRHQPLGRVDLQHAPASVSPPSGNTSLQDAPSVQAQSDRFQNQYFGLNSRLVNASHSLSGDVRNRSRGRSGWSMIGSD
jgi:hypothetical protein